MQGCGSRADTTPTQCVTKCSRDTSSSEDQRKAVHGACSEVLLVTILLALGAD